IPKSEIPSALFLADELLELRVVDLDIRVAAELLDVLVEALVVERLADPFLQIVGDVRERLVAAGLSLADTEEVDRSGHDRRRRILLGRIAEDRRVERRQQLSLRDHPEIAPAGLRVALRILPGEVRERRAVGDLRADLF